MHYTNIAIAKPFDGEPKINLADIYGASPNKPILLRIPVTGQRPITYRAENLPEGMELNNGILTGKIEQEGEYTVTLCAENELGSTQKNLTFEIRENHIQLTPLMGFTSWNAFANRVTQEKIEDVAKKMIESGIAEYGYSHVNIDSGWQKEYGGKYDAIMPNDHFPDMKKMCDTIHGYGLKCGIYSTPMKIALGCPPELTSIPGCTQGEDDELFSQRKWTRIGTVRKEKNNVKQWEEWEFDYLKYDWYPSDPYNAEMMRRELIQSNRDFGFNIGTKAPFDYVNYWSKYCQSYRCNDDSRGYWQNFIDIYNTYDEFIPAIQKGHFFDLDMLDIGTCNLFGDRKEYTEDEQICVYSLRAFMSSPIQISSTLENLDEFELSIYCNEEVIAINQDTAFAPAIPVLKIEKEKKCIHAYKKRLADGGFAIMVLNLGDTIEDVTIHFDEEMVIRDVWAKKNMGQAKALSYMFMRPHTVRMFRMYKPEK